MNWYCFRLELGRNLRLFLQFIKGWSFAPLTSIFITSSSLSVWSHGDYNGFHGKYVKVNIDSRMSQVVLVSTRGFMYIV